MIDITDFDKDQLAEYANNVFQVKLDLRKSRDRLIEEVKALQEKPESAMAEKENLPPPADFIKNLATGFVFPWTEELQKHLGAGGVACDAEGNQV